VHQKSGKRYPFVTSVDNELLPVATSVRASLDWLATVARVSVPTLETLKVTTKENTHKHTSFSFSRPSLGNTRQFTIRDWCAAQDPLTFIGRYITLNHQGVGCCPFGEHHTGGCDRHASFKVYTPGVPGGYCWYCHIWQQGGSVFDFLRLYSGVDDRSLWAELREEVRA
jgi:hypothetical protein